MKSVYAIDLGGTNLRVGLINENNEIVSILKENTISGDKFLLLAQIERMIKSLDISFYKPIGIGLGVPGRVRNDSIVDELPNLRLKDIPFKDYLEKTLNLPVFIINDAEAAALAEANVGPYSKYERLFFITLSTGIGGALSIKQKVENVCKEIGHILVNYKSNYYDLEDIASGHGIPKLCKLNNLEVKNSKEFFELVESNNLIAKNIFNDWFALIDNFIKFVTKTLSPDIITVTGGVMHSKHLFFDMLKEKNKNVEIVECYNKEDAGILGSGVFALKNI